MTLIEGTAIALRGDDIDTDRIIPARFLKAITFAGLEAHLFADDRDEAARRGAVHPFDDPARRQAAVLIAGANFGGGSSREHAPQALRRRGIRAIAGESFAEIFQSNAQTIGLPCVTVDRPALTAIRDLVERSPALVVTVDLDACCLSAADVSVPVRLPPAARAAFLSDAWDATTILLERYEDVERVAAALPY